ncbi:fumarylacetoacetate hydrolase family protein [Bradyrhizobium sp. KB893862 SZCCT0404]|uniref:fumarylacetoacetate hydrolase family protein n=1 Tax=Bradyrhizobium sp. KB893862 SZCCT0404 TaxID=2807672 RepID=UPI001BAAE524|nr:fumarylacetoacetate hydrolase family protein [Bradyrhizobium sp. KB893862 SZCCT0404]MBR1172762.1 fumarylacetoacetate hydrolase family protein [Bradyrhizobium sp. KB893862 SZCCT0404]
MKLATFSVGHEQACVGLVDPEAGRIRDLLALAKSTAGVDETSFRSMIALIESGDAGLDQLGRLAKIVEGGNVDGLALSQVKLHAPLPVPPQIRDCSVFEQHIRDAPVGMSRVRASLGIGTEIASSEVPAIYRSQPLYYISNRFGVTGPDMPIEWPRYSEVMDFELEVAVVIGRRCKNVSVERAPEQIFGFTILNDFSARDQQAKEMAGGLGPTKGKSFDCGNAMGPWIVTRDEISLPLDLGAEVRVNGQTWAKTRTKGMLHGISEIISFISTDETLHPGEVIGSGTVGGCCGLEMGRFLQDGDVVELDVERIGILRNAIKRQV